MIVTKTKGFWKLHKRFTKLQGIVGEAVDDALHQQTHRMYRKMVLNASRKDHTLDDIRRLGNPFAKRHGSIQGGMLGSEWTKKPFMVHGRKGNVARSIRYQVNDAKTNPEVVFHYRYTAPYVKYVVHGTKVMFGRNVILETLRMNEKKIKKEFTKNFFFSFNRRVYKRQQ